jgi:membrane-associated phospholipid phosphatase
MSDIFISYFHEDRTHAERLAGALEAEGLSVWWDRTIPPGENFDQVIEQALGAAKVVMVLWSLKAVKSRWVLNEAEDAAARDILVPVLIEEGVRIPLAFRRIQAARLVGWDGSQEALDFRDLMTCLVHRIACQGRPPGPAPERPEPARRTVTDGRDGAADAPARINRSRLPPLFYRRIGLTGLLAAVFVANFIETTIEMQLRNRYQIGSELGYRIAAAFRGLEGNLSFESHDVTNWVAVYGYSVAYFFLLPVLGLSVIAVLWRRPRVEGYRVLCLSITADYLISLMFFVFFPVPERWAFTESGAMLLSDRWSSGLVELLRPISGLDNCFPSTHVSLTVVIILVGYLFRLRMRHTMLVLGTTIILSTFALGIHWLPDMLAGVAVAFLSVALARRMTPVAAYAIAS